MKLLFQNNAASTIASPITSGATTVQLAVGGGTRFPTPIVGQQYFVMTFIDAATGLLNEIVWVTQRVGDVLTIVRGQEGTTPLAWAAGDSAKNLPTSQTMATFSQIEQSQAGATNYSEDTGTINSYVVALIPTVSARIRGLRIYVKANTANTGAATLNVGAGSFPLVNPDGSSLGTGAITAGGVFEAFDDGTAGPYQLLSASQQSLSSQGVATTGDVKWRPTNENIAGWVLANGGTIGNALSGASIAASAVTANLFAWHWNNFPNTQCQLFNSAGTAIARGVNAAADFAANCRIGVLDMRGMRMGLGADTMGGAVSSRLAGVPAIAGNATTPGSLLGENLHVITTSELASHNHGLNDPGHAHGVSDPGHGHATNAVAANGGIGGFQTSGGLVFFGATINGALTGISIVGALTGQSVQFFGSNVGHNTVELGLVGYIHLKL